MLVEAERLGPSWAGWGTEPGEGRGPAWARWRLTSPSQATCSRRVSSPVTSSSDCWQSFLPHRIRAYLWSPARSLESSAPTPSAVAVCTKGVHQR